jgi:hypothetical protein
MITSIANSSKSSSQVAGGVFLRTVIRSRRFLLLLNLDADLDWRNVGRLRRASTETIVARREEVLAIATNRVAVHINGRFTPTNVRRMQRGSNPKQRLAQDARLDAARNQ